MPNRYQLSRESRRGGILGVALIFFVVVTVAGAALLSISLIHRIRIVKNGIDVRLMIAAEAGMETIRGRFTLIEGVQDDWNWLSDSSWTTIDNVNINGINVHLEGRLTGNPSVPRARVRGVATAAGQTRAVEQTIKVASFSDYARFSGSTDVTGFGQNFKMVGTCYYRGGLNLRGNSGVEFFGKASTSGAVSNFGPEGRGYNFKQGYDDFIDVIDIPPAAFGRDPIKDRAVALDSTYGGSSNFPQWDVPTGFLFYRNTVSIEFNGFESGGVSGTRVTRQYLHRDTGTDNSFDSDDYSLETEVMTLPQGEEICIYIESDAPPAGFDSWDASESNYHPGDGSLELSGLIRNSRITVYAEMDVEVRNNVAYHSLMEDPTLREVDSKTSDNALGFGEILGVCAEDNVRFYFEDFDDVTAGEYGFVASGQGNIQHFLDGAFLGTDSVAAAGSNPGGNDEVWVCGCLIGIRSPSTGFGGYMITRHYDWDWRLQSTIPPFFLRAYNVTASFVPGSWRSYEL